MFNPETADLSNAIERCIELHPTVRVVGFGTYTVTGSQPGSLYTVKCYRDERWQKTVDCSCKTKDGLACKHGIAALSLHIYMATMKMLLQRRATRLARR